MEKRDYLNASTENSSVNTDSLLTKILIFKEDSLYESLNEKTNIFSKRNTLITYDTNKPKSIKIKNENNKIVIKIGDHIEDVLRELKHPNYIHYTRGQDENYNSQDKFNEINQYFNENKDEIGKSYKIENAAQLRNIINIRDFLIDNISQKNNFSEMLVNFHKDYLSLYLKVIDQINSDKLEKVEMGNEFNEFNGVIIYHRLIRSIEERIKKIDLDK